MSNRTRDLHFDSLKCQCGFEGEYVTCMKYYEMFIFQQLSGMRMNMLLIFLGGRYLDCISNFSSQDLYKFEILAHHSSPTTSNSFWMKQMGGFLSSTVKHHLFIMEQSTHPRYLKFKLIQVHESNEKKP